MTHYITIYHYTVTLTSTWIWIWIWIYEYMNVWIYEYMNACNEWVYTHVYLKPEENTPYLSVW